MPSRPMNKGRLNDHDFVPSTQYKFSRTKQPRPSFSQFELIPEFEAIELENAESSSQNLHTIDFSKGLKIFSFFKIKNFHIRFKKPAFVWPFHLK